MNVRVKRIFALLCCTLLAGLLVPACGGDDDSDSEGAETVSAAEGSQLAGGPTEMTIGLGPFYDYQLVRVADELGVAEAAGLEFEFENIPAPPLRAVRRGDLDIGYGCHTCVFPAYEAFPEYRTFMITNQFKGFVLVGREGEVRPYDEYLQEVDGDFSQAKNQFVQNEVVGKRIALNEETGLATVAGLLEQGDATTDDVELINFPDGAKAANGFVTGEADFYFGDLPQEARLLFSEEFEGQFIEAAPIQAFGPGEEGVLFYSVFFTTEGMINEERDALKRFIAMWYRSVRYLQERESEVLPIVAEAVSSSTGGVLGDDITLAAMTELQFFPNIEEASETIYNPESPLYYQNSIEHHEELAIEEGQVPGDADLQALSLEEELFNEVIEDEELMEFINAPLE